MVDRVIRKIETATTLNEAERSALADLMSKVVFFDAGQDIAEQGAGAPTVCVLLDGLACRYLALPNGQRQITAFPIAGDWIDLNSFFFDIMDHAICAVNNCRVATIPHARLLDVIETYPRLRHALWRESMIDSSISREWVVNVGARSARERMAHLFCEIQTRMEAVGLASGSTFELPITQGELAEALGISNVHANRTLQELRAEKLVVFHRKMMTFIDVEKLRELGQFDPGYLHINDRRMPRREGADAAASLALQ